MLIKTLGVFGAVLVVSIVLVQLVLTALGVTPNEMNMAKLSEGASRARIYLTPLRWAVYSLVVWQWPRIIGRLAHHRPDIWTDDTIAAGIALRPRIAFTALFIEVFVNFPTLPVLIDWVRS